MDEPFGRLDAQTRAQMHAELLRLHALLGMSIVFVTHDVDEAVVLADRVIVLAPRPGGPRDRADPAGAPARHQRGGRRGAGSGTQGDDP